MNRLYLIKFFICLCTVFILFGCAGGDTVAPEQEDNVQAGTGKTTTPGRSISVDLTTSTADDLNPDMENRASPIVIRIYQLKHIDTFDNSDFFALYENDQSLLDKDLIFKEELEIEPSQSIIKALSINADTKYIAVLAAYRDLDNAQWKAFLPINPLNLQPIKVKLEKSSVSIGFITTPQVQ